jgi:hypothetical protein
MKHALSPSRFLLTLSFAPALTNWDKCLRVLQSGLLQAQSLLLELPLPVNIWR